MLSSVLRSRRAVAVNIEIVRAFVRLRPDGRVRRRAPPEGRRARAEVRRPVPGCVRRDPGAHGAAGAGREAPDRLPAGTARGPGPPGGASRPISRLGVGPRACPRSRTSSSPPGAPSASSRRRPRPSASWTRRRGSRSPRSALLDVDGVYGAPRFHKAARAAGVRPLVGAALTLADGSRLGLLVESRAGYRALCRLLTRVKARAPKGQARATLDDLDGAVAGLLCLTGGAGRPADPGSPGGAPGGGAGDARAARPELRPGPGLRGAPAARHARERARDPPRRRPSRVRPGCPSSPPAACATRRRASARSSTS